MFQFQLTISHHWFIYMPHTEQATGRYLNHSWSNLLLQIYALLARDIIYFTPLICRMLYNCMCHDDVIKWKHFPRNWPFVRGIHRSPVNFPHKGQWRGALMFSLVCVWINDWVNNRDAGDLRRYRAHYDVIVMRFMNEVVYIDRPSNHPAYWHTGLLNP